MRVAAAPWLRSCEVPVLTRRSGLSRGVTNRMPSEKWAIGHQTKPGVSSGHQTKPGGIVVDVIILAITGRVLDKLVDAKSPIAVFQAHPSPNVDRAAVRPEHVLETRLGSRSWRTVELDICIRAF